MAAILANPLASQFNWIGKGGVKQPFRGLSLKDVLFCAVRSNIKDATDMQIANAAKNWLRYAKDRDGGRKGRAVGLPNLPTN
ncbi:hypothetical protein SKAU_G00192770 [Synaphobranchus kaupii]|uniref:Uncharacterized protein n=1 Tax=Synaphobranchus kaupii TaxID=118154 RepID=A0A9Q1IXF4_SYNKA|nr:hypothetical protein SKAU_G00192770 [Synaphobranchus kaupii]